MPKVWKAKNTISYTYESADGTRCTLHAGEDGVTEELILFLRSSDNQELLQERYQQENTCYAYQHAAAKADDNSESEAVSPMEQVIDPSADIAHLLFPDKEDDPFLYEKLLEAIEQLTESQKDLIHEMYGLCKGASEIAREQHVSEGAIRDRRAKIFRRLKKAMDLE